MARFAKIGVGAGKRSDANLLIARDAQGARRRHGRRVGSVQGAQGNQIDTGKRSSADSFRNAGVSEERLHGAHVRRGARHLRQLEGRGAVSRSISSIAEKQPLRRRQSLHAALRAGPLPPVNAFWSLTLYELPASLLYANPINRYLINSPMLPAPEARRRRRDHALRPERVAGQGQGSQLAAGAEGTVLHGVAPVLAEGRGAQRQMEGAADAARELNNMKKGRQS